MKCPYCNAEDFVPGYVILNVENYGSKVCNFPCYECGEIINAFIKRTTTVRNASKTTQKSDWAML